MSTVDIAPEFLQAEGLREKIEKVLSEILADKHECKVSLHFEQKGNKK